MSGGSAARWKGILPPQLAARVDDIHAAAMLLAYASRPADGATPAVADYWHSLPVFAQQAHFMRSAAAVAKALGMHKERAELLQWAGRAAS